MSATDTPSASAVLSCGGPAAPAESPNDKLVRYEALFKLTEELLASDTVEKSCSATAKHLKYIADAASWRLLVPWNDGFVVVDGQRGSAQINRVDELPAWDAAAWETMLPQVVTRETLLGQEGAPALLLAPGLCRMSVLPIQRAGQSRGLLFTASRQPAASPLENKFLHMVGALLADQLLAQLTHRHLIETLEQVAGEDVLTGVMNRRAVVQTLRKQLAAHRRSGLPMCVLMVDVDHFKSVNDRFGHPAGDEVLCELAKRLAGSIRDGDYFGRFGGEEFLFILHPCLGDGARVAAERLRMAVAHSPFRIESAGAPFDLPVTISVGAAVVEGRGPHGETITEDQIVKIADEALYRSKTEGRNRVTVERPHYAQTATAPSVAD